MFLGHAAHFIAIIDAGSTGSRIHLFRYGKQAPRLTEIFRFKVKPGIDQYAQQRQRVQQGYDRLLNETLKVPALTNNTSPIPVYVLATGGMRYLSSAQQTEIYNHLRKDISRHTSYSLKTIKTISGEQEALYGWLAVNDVFNRLGNQAEETLGLLDLGGASMEVAVANKTQVDGAVPLCIYGECYWITAKSILDIGIEHSLSHIQEFPSAKTCSPQEEYNFTSCESITADSISDKLLGIKKNIPLNRTYVATAGFFYTFSFFEAQPTVANLQRKTIDYCENTAWDDLVSQHPDYEPDRIRKYCFASALIATVLTEPNGFGFVPDKTSFIVAQQVRDQDIAWARGAALHIIENN